MKSNQIKKIVKLIFIFFIILFICTNCINLLVTQIKSNTEIPLMIRNDPAVMDAKIVYSDSYAFLGCDYSISILFKDGNSMIVAHVNEFGEGKTMVINYVNNYLVMIVDRNTDGGIDWKQQLDFFSVLVDAELKTVMDIVRNYRIICNEVNNWVNLSEYKQNNEKIYDTRKRVLEENIFPFPDCLIYFNGHEYFVYRSKG